MSLREEDLALLLDIYENCEDIIEFTKGMKFYEFERDKRTIKAVERSYEIIGIAANKISRETQEKLNNIQWGQIIGLRNKIAHEYGEIKVELLWEKAQSSVKELMKKLDDIEELKEFFKE